MRRLTSVAIGSLAILALSSVISRVGVNATTAGFLYLIAVLLITVWRDFPAGAASSLAATICFNFFFLPPVGTFHIAGYDNWVALLCFLIASVVASQLVLRAGERAAEADARRNEVVALYELCVDLFTASATSATLDGAVRRALASLGARSGGLLLLDEEGSDATWIGSPADFEMHKLLTQSEAAVDAPRRSEKWRNATVPVDIGRRARGSLVVYETEANQAAIESVAKLVGLAVERETYIRERAEIDALQASDEFKTALLRAVSHDLSTPLTAMMLLVSNLRRQLPAASETSLDILTEEVQRLHRRVQNLLAMARLESGELKMRREPTPAADLFRAARENLRPITATRQITVDVATECPDLDVDPSLAVEILVNLIENAHRASPGSSPIELRASACEPSMVRLDVLDRGIGLGGQSKVETTDTPRYGLGLQIAHSFAKANGGSLSLKSRIGGGARATLLLPASDRGEQPRTTT